MTIMEEGHIGLWDLKSKEHCHLGMTGTKT